MHLESELEIELTMPSFSHFNEGFCYGRYLYHCLFTLDILTICLQLSLKKKAIQKHFGI